jgi:uncharacterized repeat protein (TIGR01451 family)
LLAALLLAGRAVAQTAVLDWDQLTWLPEGTSNLSETYPNIGGGDVTVTFSGNTAGLADPTSPAINSFNTGGLIPAERSLYIATDYADSSNPQVTVFIDFSHPNGVGIVRFNVFDLDGAGTFIDRVRVTACRDPFDAVCDEIKPTLLTPGPVNEVTPPVPPQTEPDTITGLLNVGSPFDSDAGNAEFLFDVVGIRRVKLTYSNVIGPGNPGFQAISLHDVSFIPTNIADLSLDKRVDNERPEVGSQVIFTVDVFNDGPSTATGVEVMDLLPTGFRYLSDDSNGTYDPESGIWRVGTIPVNGSATINFAVEVNRNGVYTNVAEVSRSEQFDPDSTPGGGPDTEDDIDSATAVPIGADIPVAIDDFAATDIETPVDIPVLENDSGDEPLQIRDVADPANGTAVIDDRGTPLDPSDDVVVYTPDPGFTGVEVFEYTMRDASGQTAVAEVTVLVGPVFLQLTKTASPTQVLPGGLVQYTVTVENVSEVDIPTIDLADLIPAGFTYVEGSARLDGVAEGFTVSGQRPVVFEDISFAAGQTRVLTYMVRVGAGVGIGEYTNLIAPSPPIGNEASATVAILTDPDFEQTTIIGKVFHDLDGDGWQDPGEDGIPGVRLGTVEGLLVETDEYGRYHLAGIDGGFVDRGRNYIIKVDPQTLPAGSTFTTENPRVLRITQGLLSRIDFGVRVADSGACCQEIEVKLAEIFFREGSEEIEAEYFPALADLAERLRRHGGGVLTIEGNAIRGGKTPDAGYDRDLADRRAQRVYAALRRLLGEEFMRNVQFQISWSGDGVEETVAPAEIEPERTSDARSLPARVLDLLFPAALAQEPAQPPAAVQDCSVVECVSDDGYAVRIISRSHPRPPAAGDTHYVREGTEHVDISGRFATKLPGGGDVWATEDPTIVEPQLAFDGPDLLPVANGRISQPATFYVYSNYAAFVERAELIVYRATDADRVDPLAVVPIADLRGYTRVAWDGATDEPVADGDEVAIVLRVYDAQGRFDETRAATAVVVDEVVWKARPLREMGRSDPDDEERPAPWRERFGFGPRERAAGRAAIARRDGGEVPSPAQAASVEDTPLHGNVLVFRPHEKEMRTDTSVYTLTPRFDTLKTELKPHDRAELDAIVEQWKDAKEVRIEAVGHTDNVRIAPEHTHIFKDNYELSQARAWSVVNYLKDRLGVTVSHVNASGRGPDEPVASNRVEEGGRELNRRVELKITGLREVERIIEEPSVKLVDAPSGLEADLDFSLEEAENVLAARLANAALREQAAAPSQAAPGAAPAPLAPPAPGERRFPGGWSAQESGDALANIYGTSQLALQTIPLQATRVRVHGVDRGGNHSLYIDGAPVPLDREGKFAAEYLMPIGSHAFVIERTDPFGAVTDRTELPVELTGKYMFLVALADVTFANNSFSGSMEPVANDDRYEEDFLVEGRLAFYLKGKVKGKYLVTAQLDSKEEQLDNLFGNLDEKDPTAIFRRLDPDRYYPVYGDDSTTVSDTDSQGRFYLRVDWDRSQAVLGNFNTGFTGTEFAQYNRSLYGAKYHHVGTQVTKHGEPRTEGQVFVSEVQTALGHSEFSGTGGSVYYLRHRDILPGSDKAHVEVLDRDSGRVIENVELQRGLDYEVDEIQGRIILARPLAQIAPLVGPDLIKDDPLDGNLVRLLVDYEYLPDGFSSDNVAFGARGRYWVNDHIAVGGTYVDESRDEADYQLGGGDVILRAGRGTYLKLEYAESDSTQADRFLSSDGGLSFAMPGTADPDRTGAAQGVEARVNTREWLGTEQEWIGAAWWRETEGDFSVARRDLGLDTNEYGMQLSGQLGERFRLAGTASVVERDNSLEDQRVSLQADYALTSRSTISGEVRQVSQDVTTTETVEGALAGLRYTYRLFRNVDVFGAAQTVIDDDDGRYEDNALGTVGARMRLSDHTALTGEVSSGDRGDGASITLDHRIGAKHWVYGTYTHSTDRSDRPLRGTELGNDSTFALSRRLSGDQIAVGHRSSISNQLTLFNEARFEQDRSFSGLSHVFGLDFAPGPGWSIGLNVQRGDLAGFTGGIERDAAGIGLGYQNSRMRWHGRVEYRNDDGATDARQWLSANRFDYKLNEDWRVMLKANWSNTISQLDPSLDAKFVEASFGLAYRPVANDRLNVLSKVTFLHDLPSFAQAGAGTDQRSLVFSTEGIYRLSRVWELGGKVARREGSLRTSRSNGEWFDSAANFGALRVRYALIRRWDALLEYRMLDVQDAESVRSGWLAAIDRHFGDHMEIGIGYNFTDFSDDLTELDYEHSGWFLNALGKY